MAFFLPNPQEKAKMFVDAPTAFVPPPYQPVPMYTQYIQQPVISIVPTVKPHAKQTREGVSSNQWRSPEVKESPYDSSVFEFIKNEGGQERYAIFLRACHLLAEVALNSSNSFIGSDFTG